MLKKQYSSKLNLLKTLAFSLALFNIACSEQTPQKDFSKLGTPTQGGVYVSASIGEPSNLIPWLAGDSASSAVTAHIYESLLKYDKNLNLTPSLAEKWAISKNGLTFTFYLKKGITWADGTPFTSKDVLATFKTITAPTTRTPYAQSYTTVKKAYAPNPHTFIVEYAKPFAPALATWAQLAILPAHKLNEVEDIHKSPLITEPLGLGAYTLHKWKRGQEVQLKSSATYHAGTPKISLQRQRLITDLDAQFLALRKGEIDTMGLKPLQYERLTNKKSFTERYAKYRFMGRSYVYLGFNLNKPLFADKYTRQALSYATPRQTIIDGILMGHGVASFGPFMPHTWAAHPTLKPYPHDLNKAKGLLKKAGWADTNNDGILDRNGTPFSFTIITNQGNDQRIKTAEILQHAFKKLGIEVKIQIQEWATFIENTIHTRAFDAIVLGWSLPVEPNPYDVWHSTKTNPREFNFVGFNNAEADALIKKANGTFNQQERAKALHRFQEVLHEEQPYLFLYTPYSLTALHRRFKGVEEAPAGLGHNFKEWYVPKEQQLYNVNTLLTP